jgi:hypothetical protein
MSYSLLKMQERLRNIPMDGVKSVAAGNHGPAHQILGMDEIRRRDLVAKDAQAEAAEAGAQEPPMIDQYMQMAEMIGAPQRMPQGMDFPGNNIQPQAPAQIQQSMQPQNMADMMASQESPMLSPAQEPMSQGLGSAGMGYQSGGPVGTHTMPDGTVMPGRTHEEAMMHGQPMGYNEGGRVKKGFPLHPAGREDDLLRLQMMQSGLGSMDPAVIALKLGKLSDPNRIGEIVENKVLMNALRQIEGYGKEEVIGNQNEVLMEILRKREADKGYHEGGEVHKHPHWLGYEQELEKFGSQRPELVGTPMYAERRKGIRDLESFLFPEATSNLFSRYILGEKSVEEQYAELQKAASLGDERAIERLRQIDQYDLPFVDQRAGDISQNFEDIERMKSGIEERERVKRLMETPEQRIAREESENAGDAKDVSQDQAGADSGIRELSANTILAEMGDFKKPAGDEPSPDYIDRLIDSKLFQLGALTMAGKDPNPFINIGEAANKLSERVQAQEVQDRDLAIQEEFNRIREQSIKPIMSMEDFLSTNGWTKQRIENIEFLTKEEKASELAELNRLRSQWIREYSRARMPGHTFGQQTPGVNRLDARGMYTG